MIQKNNWVLLGKVLKAWGIKGQARCVAFNADSDLYLRSKTLYLLIEGEYRPLQVEFAKAHGRYYLIQFEGYTTPEAVQEICGSLLALPRDEMPELKQGEIYLADLIGFWVQGHGGNLLGHVKCFMPVGNTEVMVIVSDQEREFLVPYIEEFVEKMDQAEAKIYLKAAANPLLADS